MIAYLSLLVSLSVSKKFVVQELQRSHPEDFPLTNYQNNQYYTQIGFGSPPQIQTILFDSGSSFCLVAGNTCSNCKQAQKFNPDNSYTWSNLDDKISEQFGTGAISGILGYDFVGPVQQELVLVQQETDFPKVNFDGIIGIAGSELSEGIPTFLDNLKSQNVIEQKTFGVYLNDANEWGFKSAITFGGYDQKYFQGVLDKLPYTHDGRYNIQTDKISIQQSGSEIGSLQGETLYSKHMLIDTGTNIPVFDQRDVDQIIILFNQAGNTCSKTDKGFYFCPNWVDVVLSYHMGGKKFTVESQYFGIPIGSDMYLPFVAVQGGQGILGQFFMRKYFTYFDQEDHTIGFAMASRDSFIQDFLVGRSSD